MNHISPSDFVPREMTIDGVNFPYYKFGTGKPLFVVPAFHTDFTRIKPLLIILSEYFTIYMPELPGISINTTLNNHCHNSQNYARFLNQMIRKLNLSDYYLSGFCYGAVIVMRMLQNDSIKPKGLILFEALYDGEYLHLEKHNAIIVKLVSKLGYKNKLVRSILDLALHNKKFLSLYFRLKFRHEKNLSEVIDHQVDLTTKMNTIATIELVREILDLKFSQENLSFKIPTILIYNKTDNILDIPKTASGMQKIFPDNKLFEITLGRHAPAGPIDTNYIQEMIYPILPTIKKLSR